MHESTAVTPISADGHSGHDGNDGAVRIRPLQWADFDDLVKNYYSFHDELESYPDIGLTIDEQKPSMEEEAVWFGALYADFLTKKAVVFVAETGGRVVGICEVRRGARRPVSHVGTLGIAVLKDYRRIGIGEKLMTHTISAARELFEVIVLDVFSVNAGARHLYSKLGFRSMGVLPMAVKRQGRYFDEERMYLLCRKPGHPDK